MAFSFPLSSLLTFSEPLLGTSCLTRSWGHSRDPTAQPALMEPLVQ